MRGVGGGCGLCRLSQRDCPRQENARLRLSLLRSEAGVFELRAELERLREDLCRRAQRRRRWHWGRGERRDPGPGLCSGPAPPRGAHGCPPRDGPALP